MLKLTNLSEDELTELEALITGNITFINEALLPAELLMQTEAFLKNIDPNDTPFVALTKHLGGRLWTGDMKLYNKLKAKKFKDIVSTAELSALLNDLESK